jgi:hypothetical protein
LEARKRAEAEAAAAAAEAEANEPRGNCKHCGETVKAKDLFPCPRCYCVKYCSSKCMKADKTKHKFLCDSMAPPDAGSTESEQDAKKTKKRKSGKSKKHDSKHKKKTNKNHKANWDDSDDDEDNSSFLDFDSDESDEELFEGSSTSSRNIDEEQQYGEDDDLNRMAACSYCKTTMTMASLSACAGCQSVLYCSLECQRNHWPQHGLECADLAAKGAGTPQFDLDLVDQDFEGDDDEARETESICDNCEAEDPEDLWLMCGKCHKVVYCCAECQTEGWEYHQTVCDDLAKGRSSSSKKKAKKAKKAPFKKNKKEDKKSKSRSGKKDDDDLGLSQSKHGGRSKSKSAHSRDSSGDKHSSKKSKKSSKK